MKINNPVIHQRLIQLNREITEAINNQDYVKATKLRIEKLELLVNKYVSTK